MMFCLDTLCHDVVMHVIKIQKAPGLVTFIQLGSKFCMSGSALDTFAGCNQNIVAANCCQQAKSMPLLGDPLATIPT